MKVDETRAPIAISAPHAPEASPLDLRVASRPAVSRDGSRRIKGKTSFFYNYNHDISS
jgi:hypothetical protein